MHIKPLLDRIVVRRIDDDNITSGGIVLPEQAKETSMEGEVVALGSGKEFNNGESRPLRVDLADKVLFEQFAGTEIKFKGEKLLALREADIICILSD